MDSKLAAKVRIQRGWKLLRTARSGLRYIVALALILALELPAEAVGASPAWTISGSPYPTVFAPGSVGNAASGPGLLVTATNVGDGSTSGKFKLSVAIGDGLTPSFEQKPFGRYGPGAAPIGLDCSATNHTALCTGPGPVRPGQTIELLVPLRVIAASGVARSTATVEAGGAPPVATAIETRISALPAGFGLLPGSAGAFSYAVGLDGAPAIQAGSTPFSFGFRVGLAQVAPAEIGEPLRVPDGGVEELEARLPAGVTVNPLATPRCTEAELDTGSCPVGSQVGTIALDLSIATASPAVNQIPVFNMIPPPGSAASLGAEPAEGTSVHLLGSLRSGDFGFSTKVSEIPARIGYLGNELTLWGDPSDPGHDWTRGTCLDAGGLCGTDRLSTPFLTLPTSCGVPLKTAVRASSWINRGGPAERLVELSDPAGNPVGIDGCNKLGFSPSLETRPTSGLADSPTGLAIRLHQPQDLSPTGFTEATLREASIALPAGMAVNPASSVGLAACAVGSIGLISPIGDGHPEFDSSPAGCPDAAKVGSAQLESPLVDRPLDGGLFLAAPGENPFGSLLALYLVVEGRHSGILVKLAGKIEADAETGRLTVSFPKLPELPISALDLDFFSGPRAILRNPPTCGSHLTESRLIPSSAPGSPGANPSARFDVSVSPLQGRCPADEDLLPQVVDFSAGTASAEAGIASPLSLQLTRPDGSQRLGSMAFTLPPGLTARTAGIARCGEQAIAMALCPPAARIGTAVVGAGAGSLPLYLRGNAYLAGAYEGAPLSMVISVPAAAGPFDLGPITIRIGLRIDPITAQVEAFSGRLPTILRGIPLDIRDLRLDLDRPGFIRNPTSCEPMAIAGTATTSLGQVAPISDRFQVGDCAALPFQPKLALRLSGAIGRNGHPALRAVLKGRADEAAMAGLGFTLPAGELLDLDHVRALCRPGLAGGDCPRGSRLGRLRLRTPLLDEPLSGPIHLRTPSRRLPDLTAELGSGRFQVTLEGRAVSRHGRLGIRFAGLPDIPVSRAVLDLPGGPRGIVVNSRRLCGAGPAVARFDAHNGKQRRQRVRVRLGGRC